VNKTFKSLLVFIFCFFLLTNNLYSLALSSIIPKILAERIFQISSFFRGIKVCGLGQDFNESIDDLIKSEETLDEKYKILINKIFENNERVKKTFALLKGISKSDNVALDTKDFLYNKLTVLGRKIPGNYNPNSKTEADKFKTKIFVFMVDIEEWLYENKEKLEKGDQKILEIEESKNRKTSTDRVTFQSLEKKRKKDQEQENLRQIIKRLEELGKAWDLWREIENTIPENIGQKVIALGQKKQFYLDMVECQRLEQEKLWTEILNQLLDSLEADAVKAYFAELSRRASVNIEEKDNEFGTILYNLTECLKFAKEDEKIETDIEGLTRLVDAYLIKEDLTKLLIKGILLSKVVYFERRVKKILEYLSLNIKTEHGIKISLFEKLTEILQKQRCFMKECVEIAAEVKFYSKGGTFAPVVINTDFEKVYRRSLELPVIEVINKYLELEPEEISEEFRQILKSQKLVEQDCLYKAFKYSEKNSMVEEIVKQKEQERFFRSFDFEEKTDRQKQEILKNNLFNNSNKDIRLICVEELLRLRSVGALLYALNKSAEISEVKKQIIIGLIGLKENNNIRNIVLKAIVTIVIPKAMAKLETKERIYIENLCQMFA
jgi:hypothetical protein